jgi:hypothetical protein
MQLYAHWLDGEFVRAASGERERARNVREFIRGLKLHAILGTQFILNDVQAFDSAVVLELFANPDIYNFLCRNVGFLNLKVAPDPTLGTSNPFALAARGLARTSNPGWISSAFVNDATPIRKLASEIINDVTKDCGWVDPDSPSETVQSFPKFAKPLQAVRKAVNYFGSHNTTEQLLSSSGERTNYYDVLCETRGKLRELAENLHELALQLNIHHKDYAP